MGLHGVHLSPKLSEPPRGCGPHQTHPVVCGEEGEKEERTDTRLAIHFPRGRGYRPSASVGLSIRNRYKFHRCSSLLSPALQKVEMEAHLSGVTLRQWFSAFLILQPSNEAPHVVVTSPPTVKLYFVVAS